MNRHIPFIPGIIAVAAVVGLWSMDTASVEAQTPAVPKLSGIYTLTVNLICQATPTVPTGGTAIRLLTVNYDATTGQAYIEGYQTQGLLIVPAGSKKTGYTTAKVSSVTPYSNTATTLTASGATWNILYGRVNEQGIAESYQTSGLYMFNDVLPCMGSTVAIRKSS